MTVCANRFTPEVLLSAPRRSAATPNSDGTLAAFSVSTYSFSSHSKTAEIRVLDIKTGQSSVLVNDLNASEPTWLGDENLIVWLQSGEQGITKLLLKDADSPEKEIETIATFDGPLANLKIKRLDGDTYAVALTGQVTPSGNLYNPEKAEKPHSTVKVFSKLFVREWDAYVTENKNTIWYFAMRKSEHRYILASPGLRDALKAKAGSRAYRLESPVPPFGGGDNFDISNKGLVFIAKDPELDPALYTKTDLYYVPLKSFTEKEAPPAVAIKTGKLRGYCGNPVFSPDSKSLAFTRMMSDQYESDKAHLLVIPDIEDLGNVQEFFETEDGVGAWDRSPGSITWSRDGEQLYLTAEDCGRVKLWRVPSSPRLSEGLPTAITQDGSVTDVKTLSETSSSLFITCTSLVDNGSYCIVDPSSAYIELVSSSSKGGKTFGLSQEQVSSIWYQGAGDYLVHAWVIKPSNFDKSKKYPLAMLVHGGPQGAWAESWSTRWNPAVFAEQGYIVLTPNPTGSTGYGMDLQNGIKEDWGGRPYEDLVQGFAYIEKEMAFVDTSRAVCLGASYGGYMCNWIQGHDLGRKFKALVTHDGVFTTMNMYATDELFFPIHDFGGTFWDNRENYEKWDPARFVQNWATPHLIIHNELDYRLAVVEGLAPFNILQSKNIPSKFVSFPDENHWVLKPENSLAWHKEVFEWINKYSGVDEEAKK
ncbi:MAG: hypothetical protein M1818_001610 [Claussenomyces sp. TS43310]|nr:MAG: hypothetical protein M1818_001610 [Claussenomyces sp. TS43310]